MVAHEQKYRYVAGGQAVDAPGEFPLLGLAGLAGLVGVAAKEDEVHPVLQGVVNELVEGGKEVVEARGQPGGRVDAPVVLDAEV